MKISKKKYESVKLYIICTVLFAGMFAMLAYFALAAIDDGQQVSEETKACIEETSQRLWEKEVEIQKAATKSLESQTLMIPEINLPEIPEPQIRYELTEAERAEVERVVMAECGAEPYEGIMAVAQCILNASEKSGLRPDEAVRAFGYTATRKAPSETVKQAVSAVFDDGKEVVEEYILYFYAPAWGNGSWHETQQFVIEIGGHRFFAPQIEYTK